MKEIEPPKRFCLDQQIIIFRNALIDSLYMAEYDEEQINFLTDEYDEKVDLYRTDPRMCRFYMQYIFDLFVYGDTVKLQ